MRHYGKNGMVRKDIPAPLTPEQRRELNERQEKQKADLAAAEAQRKDDLAFLERFPNEKRIEDERLRATEYIREKLSFQEKELLLASKADESKSKGRKDKVFSATMDLAATRQDLVIINSKYEQMLLRHREINQRLDLVK